MSGPQGAKFGTEFLRAGANGLRFLIYVVYKPGYKVFDQVFLQDLLNLNNFLVNCPNDFSHDKRKKFSSTSGRFKEFTTYRTYNTFFFLSSDIRQRQCPQPIILLIHGSSKSFKVIRGEVTSQGKFSSLVQRSILSLYISVLIRLARDRL